MRLHIEFMKIKLGFFLLVLALNCGAQSSSKFEISKNEKGTYTLINKETGKALYNKCSYISKLDELPAGIAELGRNFVEIRKGKSLTLFNLQTGIEAYVIEDGREYELKAPYSHTAPKHDSTVAKYIISIYFEGKDDAKYCVLFNLKTEKAIRVLTQGKYASFTEDGTLLELTSRMAKYTYCSVIDFDGKKIVSSTPSNHFIEFEQGFTTRSDDDKSGVVDKKGNITVPFIYESLSYTTNGFLVAINDNGKAGVVKWNGNVVVPFEYLGISPIIYSKTGAFIMHKDLSNGNFVLVDTNNTILFPAQTYIDAQGFDWEGSRFLVVQGKNELFGIYDTHKKEAIFPCEYNFAKNFKMWDANLVVAYKNGKFGLLNLLTGTVQIPFEYQPDHSPFTKNGEGGYFYLAKAGKKGIVDLSGKLLVPFKYDDISSSYQNVYWIVKLDGLYGLIDKETGEKILPIEYSRITTRLKLEKREEDLLKKGYFSTSKEVIWQN